MTDYSELRAAAERLLFSDEQPEQLRYSNICKYFAAAKPEVIISLLDQIAASAARGAAPEDPDGKSWLVCDQPGCELLVQMKDIYGGYLCPTHGTVGYRKVPVRCTCRSGAERLKAGGHEDYCPLAARPPIGGEHG